MYFRQKWNQIRIIVWSYKFPPLPHVNRFLFFFAQPRYGSVPGDPHWGSSRRCKNFWWPTGCIWKHMPASMTEASSVSLRALAAVKLGGHTSCCFPVAFRWAKTVPHSVLLECAFNISLLFPFNFFFLRVFTFQRLFHCFLREKRLKF